MPRPLLLAILAVGLSSAQAQDADRLFPHGVGDRWVYEVEGVAPYYAEGVTPYYASADTVDATVEWRMVEVRPSAEADTLVLEVTRTPRTGGTGDVSTCELIQGGEGSHFLTTVGAAPPEGSFTACHIGGGIPLSSNTYPFLRGPDSTATRTVTIGDDRYTREVGLAFFLYSYYWPIRGDNFETAEIRSVLAEGIGQIEMEATYFRREGSVRLRQDTLRARLVGAEVGGVVYGRIQPVSAGPAPLRPALDLAAYPNPTTSGVTLAFSLAAPGEVAVDVLDATGRTVRTASFGRRPGGAGSARLALDGLPAGVYAVRLRAGGAAATVRVAVAR